MKKLKSFKSLNQKQLIQINGGNIFDDLIDKVIDYAIDYVVDRAKDFIDDGRPQL